MNLVMDGAVKIDEDKSRWNGKIVDTKFEKGSVERCDERETKTVKYIGVQIESQNKTSHRETQDRKSQKTTVSAILRKEKLMGNAIIASQEVHRIAKNEQPKHQEEMIPFKM